MTQLNQANFRPKSLLCTIALLLESICKQVLSTTLNVGRPGSLGSSFALAPEQPTHYDYNLNMPSGGY